MDTSVIITTLVLYNIVLIAIGLWAESRTKTQEDFFLGGRKLGPIVGAISYSASAASAWTLLGMSGAAYVLGFSALWIAGGAVLGCIIAWLWVAPKMMTYSRKNNILTLTDFLAHGTDDGWKKASVIFASIVILISFTFYIASQFQGAGNTFALTFGISASSSIMLGGGVILLYTLLGGFWAVSVTDTLQGMLMLLSAVLLPTAAYVELVSQAGSFSAGLESVYDADALTLSGKNIGMAAIGMIVGNLAVGLGAIGQPHLNVRFMAMRDKKALNIARIIGIAWYAIVFFGMCLLGMIGHALMPNIDNPENIFFALTESVFTPIIGAILLATVLSAIMSTADSMLLVAASTLAHDLGLGKYFTGREILISRIAIIGISALSIVVAIYLPASIFSRVLFAWNALGAAFGPLVLVRLAGIKIQQSYAFFAMVTGFSLAVLFYSMDNPPGDILERVAPFTCGIIILMLSKVKK